MKLVAKYLKVMLIVITGLILVACSSGEGEVEGSEGESSGSGEGDTVHMLTSVTGGKDEEGMEKFEEALSDLAGYPVDMEKPASDYNRILLQKLRSGGEGLDLVYFDQNQLYDLVDQGALLDITDYIAESEILSDPSIIPQEEWDNIEIDGRYYAGFNKKEVHRVVNINEALLDEHGITLEEESLDGYYQLFTDLKEAVNDPNFYPLNTVLSDLFDIQPWMASEGLREGIIEDENGNTSVPYASNESIVVWEWLQQLYEEELLDPSSLTDTTAELRNKFQSSQTGVVVDWAAWTGLYNANAEDDYPESFEAVPYGGIKNEEGDYMLTRGVASLWGIPASSDNIEGAMKVLETFATQEGGDLLSVGVEGYAYTMEDGEFKHTEIGAMANNDHGAPFPINEQYESPAEYNPGVEEALDLLDYAEVPMVTSEANQVSEIIAEQGMNIVAGEISAEEGVANMQEQLRTNGIIE